MATIRSGFVGVLGRTNVGKSSFINAILGRKLLIVSNKHQSTRNRIRCIYNESDVQIVFIDTPGLHKPVDKLSNYLIKQAFGALADLDLVLYMVEPWGEIPAYDQEMIKRMRSLASPKFLLINKSDTAKGNAVAETIQTYGELDVFNEIVPISCVDGTNLLRSIELIKAYLPEGPRYFPEEASTDRPETFVIAEFVREAVYRHTRQEVPYSTYVEIVEVNERQDGSLLAIYATIYVARRSQKGILIGDRGEMIKRIGQEARQLIETLLGTQVYLDLHVKVADKWNEDEAHIARSLGASST